MSLGTYALCKHGPRHPTRGCGCGFAHRLSEVGIPAGAMRSLWRDRSGARGGPSGIDWFVGQDYSQVQWERLLLYLGSEPISSMPPWAKRLAWYMRLGDLDDYVCDGDFGWAADAQQYLDIEVAYGETRRPCFPFDLVHDRISSGMTLHDRMCRRMRYHGAHYRLYRARVSWRDAPAFVLATGRSGCSYDRQYLNLVGGEYYVRILESSGDVPWWYMVPTTALPKILKRGGWAPPVYFEPTGGLIEMYEVPVDELTLVSDQSAQVEVPPPLPCDLDIRVYVDGSTDDGRGIAAGCLATSLCLSMRASLALPGMTGGESSELLGLVLGLCVCMKSRRMFQLVQGEYLSFVLLVESEDTCMHVFQEPEPTEARGSDLWPVISLARNLVSRLRQHEHQVYAEQVVSRKNLAQYIARSEMLYRRKRGWEPLEDSWPDAVPSVFREVWHDVLRSRSGESMSKRSVVHNKMRKGYELSDGVLHALDSLAVA